ncbi:MAG: EAL domain-containing protein [Burkholderiaceae bacterium]
MHTESVQPMSVGLTPELLHAAFPFHIVLDNQLSVVQIGMSMRLLDETLDVGSVSSEHLILQRPIVSWDYSALRDASKSIFLLSLAYRKDVRLRGQFLSDEVNRYLIFIGSPHFTNADDIKSAGLKLNNFAAHDSTPDLLLLLRTNQTSLEDAEKLAKELRREKEHAQIILSSIGEAVVAADANGRVSYMNAVAEQLCGRTQRDAKNQPLHDVFDLIDAASREPALHWLDKLATTRSAVELPQSSVLLRRDNDEIVVEGVVASIQGKEDRSEGMVLVFRDVTDQRNMAKLMEYQATHEPLTKLPNRMLLYERADQAIYQAKRREEHIAMLFLDLDRFKTINDSLGHQIGDRLLEVVAKRLVAAVRDADVVSRLGGDEFVIMLTQVTNPHAAGVVAKKVIAALSEPVVIEKYELNISVSIGISTYPDDSLDVNGLLRCADLAMYSAKESGRDTFRFFEKTLDAAAVERMTIENHLRVALERDQFELYYQPKLSTDTKEVVGCEALLRWNHPGRGLIPPDRFIPIAEETGIILELGKWVIYEACQQAQRWNSELGKRFTMAVNVSWLQLYQSDIKSIIVDALDKSGLPAELLELEFTESVLMRNSTTACDTLIGLRELGVRLSIDDFGTGYSSLNYLKRFPLDALKIDRSFIADMCDNNESLSIVEAIINLCQILGLQVVAEGVETAGQHSQLLRLGCEQVQGYFFSKPVKAVDFQKILVRGHCKTIYQSPPRTAVADPQDASNV